MRFFFLVFPLIFFSQAVHAEPTIVVKGVVISFDQKIIVLKDKQATINVPRSSYPDLKKVVIGRTKIEVRMSPQQAFELNPHFPVRK